MKTFAAIFISSLLIPTLWLAHSLDDWVGASLSFSFEAIFIAICAFLGVAAFSIRKHWVFLLLALCSIGFVLMLQLLDLTPVKPTVRALAEIKPGMTMSQVVEILNRAYPKYGRFRRPEYGFHDNVLSYVVDKSDSRYDSAIVQIRFTQGKCVGSEFLPD